jgi:hypothetical protein
MKTLYFKRFTLVLAIVLLGHLGLLLSGLIPGNPDQGLIVLGSILLIFVLGFLIILPGFKKGPENFAMRFMALTTVQLLLMLTLILILITVKVPDARYWGFTAISIFIFLLAVQSFLFIREVNRKL